MYMQVINSFNKLNFQNFEFFLNFHFKMINSYEQ